MSNKPLPMTSPEIEPPRFLDGYPQNLAAAALDALEWFQWLDNRLGKMRLPGWEENQVRLRGCIKELKTYIPKGEPVYETKREKTEQADEPQT